jgi:hypothetical protein
VHTTKRPLSKQHADKTRPFLSSWNIFTTCIPLVDLVSSFFKSHLCIFPSSEHRNCFSLFYSAFPPRNFGHRLIHHTNPPHPKTKADRNKDNQSICVDTLIPGIAAPTTTSFTPPALKSAEIACFPGTHPMYGVQTCAEICKWNATVTPAIIAVNAQKIIR